MKPPSVTSDMYGSQRSIDAEVRACLQKSIQADDPPEVIVTDSAERQSSLVGDNQGYQAKESKKEEPPREKQEVAAESATDLASLSWISVVKISFKRISWNLYLALLLTKLIPTVYRTTRVYYLGDLPNDHGVNIASQLTWVNLILEVVQESLILPLFYMIGVTLDDQRETRNRVKTGLIFTFLVHVVFGGIIVAAAEPLIKFMAQDADLIDETVIYIRLEMVSIPLNSVVQFVTVVFTLYQWQRNIYTVLGIRLILSVLLDTFFLSQFDFSLKLGVNGIAYGNMIATGVTCLYCIFVLFLKFGANCICGRMSLSWMTKWGSVGFYSGLDSLVRNLFYTLCVVRMMNVIAEQGTYWRANEFIWNWLLLAFLPMADVLKQDIGASTNPVMNHKVKMAGYMIFTIILAIIWCATIPAWKPFFETVMNIPEEDVNEVFKLVIILMPAYIIFMINTLMDSVFIGKGKTIMLAIQSIITNILVFGVSFVLYLSNVYEPTLTNISLLFGISIIVDSLITTGLYVVYIKKINYKI